MKPLDILYAKFTNLFALLYIYGYMSFYMSRYFPNTRDYYFIFSETFRHIYDKFTVIVCSIYYICFYVSCIWILRVPLFYTPLTKIISMKIYKEIACNKY